MRRGYPLTNMSTASRGMKEINRASNDFCLWVDCALSLIDI